MKILHILKMADDDTIAHVIVNDDELDKVYSAIDAADPHNMMWVDDITPDTLTDALQRIKRCQATGDIE